MAYSISGIKCTYSKTSVANEQNVTSPTNAPRAFGGSNNMESKSSCGENTINGLLTYKQAARRLGMNVNTLYAWVCQKKIPHKRLSRRLVRFDADELERWIAERHVSAE
jgi:excisionase family DNA binding protein